PLLLDLGVADHPIRTATHRASFDPPQEEDFVASGLLIGFQREVVGVGRIQAVEVCVQLLDEGHCLGVGRGGMLEGGNDHPGNGTLARWPPSSPASSRARSLGRSCGGTSAVWRSCRSTRSAVGTRSWFRSKRSTTGSIARTTSVTICSASPR